MKKILFLFGLLLVGCSSSPQSIEDLGGSIEREGQLLVLQNVGLTQLPDVCAYLTGDVALGIRSLDLINNSLNIVSGDLSCLLNLTEIDVSFNQVTQIDDVGVPLKKLFAQGNVISSITDISGAYTGLQSLVINQNELEDLSGVQRFTNLINLEAHNNKITSLDGVETLQQLEKIKLEGNRVSSIQILDQIPNLGFVTARRNQIPEEELLPREQKTKTYIGNHDL